MLTLRILFVFFMADLSLVSGMTRTWKTTFVRKSWTQSKGSRSSSNGFTNFATTMFDTRIGIQALYGRNCSTVAMPLMVRFSLCKLLHYAKGPALDQIKKSFNFRREYKSCNVEVPVILNLLSSSTFLVINKIYVQMSDDLSPAFLKEPTPKYGVNVEAYALNKSRLTTMYINSWFEQATLHRIRDIVKRGELDNNTSMLLMSAAHIKSTWHYPFDILKTKNHIFRGPGGKLITVPMMKTNDMVTYYHDPVNGFEIMSTKMFTYGIWMTIILPEYKVRVPDLLILFLQHPDVLEKARENMDIKSVEIMIPRFKIQSDISYHNLLKVNGITQIFDPQSSGLDGVLRGHEHMSNIFVNLVKQQIAIDVDEYGTYRGDYPKNKVDDLSPDLQFTADRPFLFSIDMTVTDDGDRAGLLMGVYYGPQE